MSTSTGQRLASLSHWIDGSPANAERDPEAVLWGRIGKIGEEFGEAIAALIGVTGQNPRKGMFGNLADLEKELLDVAVTALAAVEHLQSNEGDSIVCLDEHVRSLLERAGLQDKL